MTEEQQSDQTFQEIWVNMEKLGYPNYSVSNFGRVKNDVSNKIILGSTVRGYKLIYLPHVTGKSKYIPVHRLIALSFLGEPPDIGMSVDHINRDRSDNRLSNLRWATQKQQCLNKTFSQSSITTKKVEQCKMDGSIIKVWNSRIEAANSLGLNVRRITACCTGKKKFYRNYLWRNSIIQDKPGEIWKPSIDPDFAGFFVSSLGRVRTLNNTITYGSESSGYKRTSIRNNGIVKTKMVHCLIAESFLGKQDLYVNHKDGNKSNNMIQNLEYVTLNENTQHAFDTGLHSGQTAVIKCDINGIELDRYQSIKKAETSLGVGGIWSVLAGKTKTAGGYVWKRVQDKPTNMAIKLDDEIIEDSLQLDDEIVEDSLQLEGDLF